MAAPDVGRRADDSPDAGASRPERAEPPDSREPGEDTSAEPLTPEELVSQRWLGMEWPTAAVSDLGLSTAPGRLEIVRHTAPDLHTMSLRVARYWLESANDALPLVVLVSGTSWPEIAAAASLAGRLDAPMLVVPADGLSPQVSALLETAGVERAVLVDDADGALKLALNELDALGIAVEQVVEDDRYATAAAVAEHLVVGEDSASARRTAIITSAADPATAAVAVSLAATHGLPLLFSPAENLHAATAEFIADHRIERVLLIGTARDFSVAVTEALEAAGTGVVPVSADTPAELALSASDSHEGSLDAETRCTTGPRRLAIASPDDPLHALVAMPLLAQSCTPLVYTDNGTLPSRVRNDIYLARHSHRGAQVHVFADPEHIPDSTVDIALPPIRLAFPVTDPALPGFDNTMAIIDEQRRVTLHLQGEDVSGINWLAWSPSAPLLAFAAEQHETDGLFLLDPVTGITRRLTPSDRALWLSTWAPAQWSPTGTHIALSAYDDPKGTDPDQDADLYVVDIASDTLQVLAASEDHDQFLYWNPAGDRILFLRHDQFGTPLGWMPPRDRIYLANITDLTVTALDLDGEALWGAEWSPDSRLIAMALVDDETLHSGGLGTPRIHLIASDQARVASADDCLIDGYVLGWSADGTQLAVSQVLSDGDNNESRVATVEVANRQLIELIEPPDLSPDEHLRFWSWAPHSNTMLFDRYNTTAHDTASLLLIDAARPRPLRLPGPVAQAEYRPFGFSSDGTQVGSQVFAQGMRLIVGTDTHSGGSERLLLDVTEFTGHRGGEPWADMIFHWDESGLSGTIEWYADY